MLALIHLGLDSDPFGDTARAHVGASSDIRSTSIAASLPVSTKEHHTSHFLC